MIMLPHQPGLPFRVLNAVIAIKFRQVPPYKSLVQEGVSSAGLLTR